ncbi:MAG: pentapeptide repeat-containing protein, partial [Anaerolineae bacterium]|nr:pentapeptide repeat-containing protein [Anaerolineae bacterium]
MKTKTAADILRQYKAGYRDFKGVVVSDGNLSNNRLSNAVFEGATLTGCSFEGSILTGSNLSAASLRGVN